MWYYSHIKHDERGMDMKQRQYIAIDLKSFYASVECMQRGLDPMTTNLVVADPTKTDKTIVLAVAPALKAYGIPGRPRLFEVVQKVREANNQRRQKAPRRTFVGSSTDDTELKANPQLAIDYITAPPQMAKYMHISTQIYRIYLRYIAPEDIHVYSIDEVFIDATDYLTAYACTAHELAMRMIRDVLATTGITATAGIGDNLYLAKIAMDIMAKRMPADKDGVRIAELTETSYRQHLWSHTPLTDFWRVGRGTATKLAAYGMRTMGDVARCSLNNEDLLYKVFGINAELLIDHAWGHEPCRIADIKTYKPETNSLCSGQVLPCPYPHDKARLIVHEMIDLLSLDLVEKRLVTDQIVLHLGYDIEDVAGDYDGDTDTDRYGRKVPRHAHGTQNLPSPTASTKLLTEATLTLFDRIINPKLHVRRVSLTACRVIPETSVATETDGYEQLSLFTDYAERQRQQERQTASLQRERARNDAIIALRHRYGKNAVLKGMNLQEGATTKQRNSLIGGHSAGQDNKEG